MSLWWRGWFKQLMDSNNSNLESLEIIKYDTFFVRDSRVLPSLFLIYCSILICLLTAGAPVMRMRGPMMQGTQSA